MRRYARLRLAAMGQWFVVLTFPYRVYRKQMINTRRRDAPCSTVDIQNLSFLATYPFVFSADP